MGEFDLDYPIPDPTLVAVAAYPITVQEIVLGWFLLTLLPFFYFMSKTLHNIDGPPDLAITRTPEKAFKGFREPFAPHYMNVYDRVHNRTMRVHYLDEGNPSAREVVVCLHGEPFWSYSYNKLIPFLTDRGYRVIAPDFVGFGRSDKYIDWKAYTLDLHTQTLFQIMRHLRLDNTKEANVTLLGGDWGFLAGANMMKDYPDMFDRLIILNTNSLPDGELNLSRWTGNIILFHKFLAYTAPFYAFHGFINMLRYTAPLQLLFFGMQPSYTFEDLKGLTAPYNRVHVDRGGIISWPLLIPLLKTHPGASEFRRTRVFLATQWKRPTLIAWSEQGLIPGRGDFVLGNRRLFFQKLIPHAISVPPIPGGHQLPYDNPEAVAFHTIQFIEST